MGNLFTILWIAILPLLVNTNGFEDSKITWFLFSGLFLGILMASKRKINFSLFLIWVIWLTTTSAIGVHPEMSIIGGSYRHQGVVFFLVLFLLINFLKNISKKEKIMAINAVKIILSFEFIVIIFQFIKKIGTPDGRIYGTLGDPNALAGYLIMASVFFNKNKIILFLIFIAMLLTGSRSGLAIYLFLLFATHVPKKKINLILSALAASAFIYFYFVNTIRPVNIFEDRFLYWTIAIENIIENPITGYGAESGEYIYNRAYAKMNVPLHDLIVDRSHNLILDLLMWSGVVGLLLFSSWIIFEIKILHKRKAIINILGIISFLLFASLHPLGVTHWVMLVFILTL